jgi:hypothetical protein
MSNESFGRPIAELLVPESTIQTRILVALLDLSEAMNRTRRSLEMIEGRMASLEQRIQQLESSLSRPPSFVVESPRGWFYTGPEPAVPESKLQWLDQFRTERLVKDAARMAIYSKVGVPLARIGFVGSMLVAMAILLYTGLVIPSTPFLLVTAFCAYAYRFFMKELKPLRLTKSEKEPARGSGSH